ncbi:hypothetical protein V1520DRAFT_54947 [Lipomyces starkeyi]|uniref:Uncharacterized protein n=1 Tax=Lipomyces starkeyi NRRL Y-11557 TaxID=675824 RepID=A0A1E3Q1L0_LIPST|nr:hypothetical protein LIPSTDRAFT_106018 [Lipomyces starkeyi NRRL Y-11557]
MSEMSKLAIISYDAGDRQTLCTGVAPPATGKLTEITYTEFDSNFTWTPDHRLTLVTTDARPALSPWPSGQIF